MAFVSEMELGKRENGNSRCRDLRETRKMHSETKTTLVLSALKSILL